LSDIRPVRALIIQDIWKNIKALKKFRFSVPHFCSAIGSMIYGYARVSTGAQELSNQLAN
jgi:hypothetical protein